MSEIFTITCKNVSVSAVQDILCAYAASTKKLRLLGGNVSAKDQATVGNLAFSVRYLPATVTAGSGGTAVTPHNINPDGASASFTARANDITQASSSGTTEILDDMLNPINGWIMPMPPLPLADEPKCDLSGAFVFSLDTAPASSVHISATMWLREE